MRSNYIKTIIDWTQQNCKCRSCGDRNETVNYKISEYIQLAQQDYKTWHGGIGDSLGTVID